MCSRAGSRRAGQTQGRHGQLVAAPRRRYRFDPKITDSHRSGNPDEQRPVDVIFTVPHTEEPEIGMWTGTGLVKLRYRMCVIRTANGEPAPRDESQIRPGQTRAVARIIVVAVCARRWIFRAVPCGSSGLSPCSLPGGGRTPVLPVRRRERDPSGSHLAPIFGRNGCPSAFCERIGAGRCAARCGKWFHEA